MQLITEYPGPRPDDYANVLALNTAYLKATSALKGPQRGRLAATPFLLFSLREADLTWWQAAMAETSQQDMLDGDELDDPNLIKIQTAALSFLWQLARRDAHAARLVSGATIAWCELVTATPLLILLDKAAARSDLLQCRLAASDDTAKRLLAKGTSGSASLRRSSQLSALQTLLTHTSAEPYRRLPSAACNMSGPMRVFEKKL